jgi:hypothetical protein
MNRETKPTTTTIPTADNIPEAFLETLKYKPFRFGDYYYLQQPELELRNQLDVAIDSLAELTTHIFNRTHQSRYTVFPTLYQQFKQLLDYTDNIIFNSTDNTSNHKLIDNSYFINLMFRESKLVGFRYIDRPTISGIYFMSYYNARVDLRPITHIYVIKREHLVSIIDYLEEYNNTGFVLRTSFTKQPIKKVKS